MGINPTAETVETKLVWIPISSGARPEPDRWNVLLYPDPLSDYDSACLGKWDEEDFINEEGTPFTDHFTHYAVISAGPMGELATARR